MDRDTLLEIMQEKKDYAEQYISVIEPPFTMQLLCPEIDMDVEAAVLNSVIKEVFGENGHLLLSINGIDGSYGVLISK